MNQQEELDLISRCFKFLVNIIAYFNLFVAFVCLFSGNPETFFLGLTTYLILRWLTVYRWK